jgi:hypothetical protein
MSVTLAQIGYSIRNQVKGFFSSDDEKIDIEFIYKQVRDVRSLLIKKLSLSKQSLDPSLYQECCCLEIKCDQIICNGVLSPDKVQYVDMPHTENIDNAIAFFGTADKKTAFKERSFMGRLYGDAATWTGKTPWFTIIGDKAIVGNLPTVGMKYLCVVAIMEDPLLCAGACYPTTENDHYPVPANMVHELELIAIKQLMSVNQTVADLKNNAEDNPRDDQRS